MYNNLTEAMAAWQADAPMHAQLGVHLPAVRGYTFEGITQNDFRLAMDAQPALTTDPNSAVLSMFTTLIDPTIFEVLFAPTKAAEICGEVQKGSWTDDTAVFPVVEHVGEVSSYGDYATSGMTGANMNWPQRQSYLFQTIKRYGDREVDRAGLGRINWVTELDKSAANNLKRFSNLTYFYGVNGLVNYGLFNDPNLDAPITPALKAYGGYTWYSGGTVRATANEIFQDIQDLVTQLISQTAGLIDTDADMTLALSPVSQAAFSTTNSFGVNVKQLIKDNYPNMKVVTAVQYGEQTTQNPQGMPAGNFMQLIVKSIEGQQTLFCGYNEKMRSHPLVRMISSYEQKITAGTWGTIIRMPIGIAGMLGI